MVRGFGVGFQLIVFAPIGIWNESASEPNLASVQLTASSSQYCIYADSAGDLTGGECVVKWLMNFDSLPGNGVVYAVCGKFHSTQSRRAIFVSVVGQTTNVSVQMRVEESGGDRITLGWDESLSTSTSYLCELTWDGSLTDAAQGTFALDSVDQGTGSIINQVGAVTTMQAVTNNEFAVGRSASFGYYFDGRIDELEVWLDLAKTSAFGYWKFDNDLTDSSGNGNDLTGVNSPTFGDPLS